MKSVNNFIENTLEDNLQQAYKDDLEEGVDSMPVTIACEEFSHLILAILQGASTEDSMEAVEALREGVYDMYKEQKGDDIASSMKDNLVYGD